MGTTAARPPVTTAPEHLTTTRGACRQLAISRFTFYQLIRAGHFHPVYVGGKWIRVRQSEIDGFVSRGGCKTLERVEERESQPA
jgi:excisionase family DNA binding protein